MRCHTEGMRLTLGIHDGKIYRAEMPDRVLIAIKDTEVRLKTAPIAGNQLRHQFVLSISALFDVFLLSILTWSLFFKTQHCCDMYFGLRLLHCWILVFYPFFYTAPKRPSWPTAGQPWYRGM
jgi:hypothetical protein